MGFSLLTLGLVGGCWDCCVDSVSIISDFGVIGSQSTPEGADRFAECHMRELLGPCAGGR